MSLETVFDLQRWRLVVKHDVTEQEQWRHAPGYGGLYSASDQGRVRSERDGGRILKQRKKPTGYCLVTIYTCGKRKPIYVHKIVMSAFVGPRPPGYEVAHNNGNPADNRLSNLRYATVRDNRLDIHRHGRMVGTQKLTEAQAMEIMRRLDAGEMQVVLAEKFGVREPTINAIKRGITWRHLRTHGPIGTSEAPK